MKTNHFLTITFFMASAIAMPREAKADKSLIEVKIKVSSHRLRSFYRISRLMLPSFLDSDSLYW